VGVLVVALVGLFAPRAASADWFVNPFLGKITKIDFFDPTAESPSVWGIAGGGGVSGFIGGEADYTVSNEFFGSEAEIGSNRFRMVTGSVLGSYPIRINGITRIQPYAAFGGGLGILDQGLEFFPDFDQIGQLPFARQQQLFDCLYPDPEGEIPSREQILACGAPLTQEESESGYTGLLGVGGGVFALVVPHVGVRVDFRRFWRVPSDEERFTFWRYTFGVVIH
jgi:hypothetical protein